MANRKGECGSRHRFSLLGSEITTDGDCSREMRRRLFLRRKVTTTLDSVLETRRHFADKHPCSQGCGFRSSHVWMWELDHKESGVLKNWCFRTMVLEKTLESPLDSKEIKPVNLKGNQPWILTGRTNDEAETPILWPPDVNSQLTGKDPDAKKDWGQEEKEATEDEMVAWHHWLNGHEFEQAPGDSEGQQNLAFCSSWGRKESDMPDRLKNNH